MDMVLDWFADNQWDRRVFASFAGHHRMQSVNGDVFDVVQFFFQADVISRREVNLALEAFVGLFVECFCNLPAGGTVIRLAFTGRYLLLSTAFDFPTGHACQ